MYFRKPNARDRTRRRVRSSLWLACALAIGVPAWAAATFWLLHGTAATVAALAPVVAYVIWRAASELTEENDAGVSKLDRVWGWVEKYLPNAAFRRVAWRSVRVIVAMGAVVAVAFVAFQLGPRPATRNTAAPDLPPVPTPVPEALIETRYVPGFFAVKVDSTPQLVWPAYGHIASFYGAGNPYGISIAALPEGDARVLAIAPGKVAYAGPDICCGYGFSIVLEHEGGWRTTYGHLASLSVAQDERMKLGDTLGYGGANGNALRTLHFQVDRAGTPYDPLQVLPTTQMGLPLRLATNQMCGSEAMVLEPHSVVRVALTSSALLHYELDAATITAETPGAPSVNAGVTGLLSFMLEVPPSGDADHTLHLALHRADDRIVIDCALAVRTANDVPLGLEPVRRTTAPITPTPFGGPPTPTPSASPSVTPSPQATGEPQTAVPPPQRTPTPLPALLRVIPTRTPTPTPRPSQTNGTPTKPNGTVRPSPTATPVRVATETWFPKQYSLGSVAAEP